MCIRDRIHTDLEPMPLLRALQKIERKIGRRQDAKRWSTRIIDLDILAIEEEIISTPDLNIPHSEINNRDFIIKLIDEVWPEWKQPVK